MDTAYVTSEEMKNTLSLAGTTYADEDLAASITAASRAIDNLCGRRFYADDDNTSIRYYSPADAHGLEIADLIALSSLATDADGDGTYEQTWTQNTDFVLEPLDATADSAEVRPYTKISVHPAGRYVFPTAYPRTVKLTGRFGWVAVPDAITLATKLLANRLLTTSRSAPLGIVAFDGGAIRIARMDSQVMMLIGSYIRHRVAVA